MHKWFGAVRGGLAMGTVVICTLIAAMSGIAGAGVVTMGIIALPEMLKRNYNKTLAIGPILAGGALALLIPPSIAFIIYGMLAGESIGKLFLGGIIPGLILSSFYIIYIFIRAYFQPHLAPCLPPEERAVLKEKLISLRALILPGFLIIGVLGSIFTGLATATEAAAVGALGSLISAALHRRLNWKLIKEASYRTFAINGMIMWVVLGAMCFTAVFAATGGPQLARDFVSNLELHPLLIIMIMQVSYLFLGMFMDEISMLMITLPIYLPIIEMLGFGKLWFGVLFLINTQVAFLSPPFGFNLFYMRAIAPEDVTMGDIYRSIIPFVGMQIIGLALVMIFPQLALWLPSLFLK